MPARKNPAMAMGGTPEAKGGGSPDRLPVAPARMALSGGGYAAASFRALEGGRALILCWPLPADRPRPGQEPGWKGMALVCKPTGSAIPDLSLVRIASPSFVPDPDGQDGGYAGVLDFCAMAMDLVAEQGAEEGQARTAGAFMRDTQTRQSSRSSLSAFRSGSARKAAQMDEWARFNGTSAKVLIDPRYRLPVIPPGFRINAGDRRKLAGFAVVDALPLSGDTPGQFSLEGLARLAMSAGCHPFSGELTERGDRRRGLGLQAFGKELASVAGRLQALPMFQAFTEEIDPALARSALRACPDASTLSIGFYGLRDEEKGLARRQAAAAWPLLADFLARRSTIRAAIDRREPVLPLAIEATGLTKGGLKRLSAIDDPGVARGAIFEAGEEIHGVDGLGYDRLRRLSVSGAFGMNDALTVLKDLPPDWVPSGNEEWTAFGEIVAGAVLPLQRAYDLKPQDLLRGAKGRWVDYRNQMARAVEMDPGAMDRRAIALSVIDTLEISDCLARQVVLPLALQAIRGEEFPVPARADTPMILISQQAAIAAMMHKSRNGLVGMFEVSRRWITRANAINELLPDPRSFLAESAAISAVRSAGIQVKPEWIEGMWEPITDPYVAANGLVVTPLLSFEALQEESRRMHHCVGLSRTYSNRCQWGTGHIVSMRSADGATSFSTAEIGKVGPGDVTFRTLQHQGPSNNRRGPSAEARQAYKEWQDAIVEGRISIRHAELSAYADFAVRHYEEQMRGRADNRGANISWQGLCGFDPQNREILEAVWQPWREVLGGEMGKGENPGILFRLPETQAVVEMISPAAYLSLRQKSRRSPAPGTQEPAGAAPAG